MPFVLPSDPSPGNVAPASWGDAVRAGLNYLANPPACRVWHNTTQSIPHAASTGLVFNSERYDTDSMHSTSSNTGRITFNTAGLYLVQFHAQMQTAADYTLVEFFIRLNASPIICLATIGTHASPTDGPAQSVSAVYKFAVGDWIQPHIFQVNSAAAARLVNAGTAVNQFMAEFSATWVGLG